MNDFTRYELILMYHNFAETEFRGTNAKLNSIRQKIKDMIDNYCDNKCDHNFMFCKELYGQPDDKYRCTKCLIAHEDLNDYQ